MKFEKLLPVFLFLLFTLLAARDFLQPGFFSIHDDLQIGRLYQMDRCFQDGQIPCRWVPDMGYSYGYPLFNYYPPLPFYLGQFFRSFGLSYIDITKILFALPLFLSGYLMYLFARRLWGEWGGFLSGVLYLFAPYHAIDVFVRGALNEMWALTVLPGILWAAELLLEKKTLPRISLLALFIGLLLLSHNVMTMIFVPVVAGYLAICLLQTRSFNLKTISYFALSGAWGLGLAAFFTLPVVVEQRLVHVETMFMGYFNYLAHYVSIGKMLFTRYWGYGSSGWLQETGMPFQVGLPLWPLSLIVFMLALFHILKKRRLDTQSVLVVYFFAVFLFTMFLVHPRSVFIWDAIPALAVLQFPWRFLTLVAFGAAVAGGGLLVYLKKFTSFVTIALSLTVILFNYSYFRIEKPLSVTDTDKLFSAKGWRKLQTDAIFDYLPKTAKFPPADEAFKNPQVALGQINITDYQRGTDWYHFSYTSSSGGQVIIPAYDYPEWKATVTKYKQTTDQSSRTTEELETTRTGELGLVTLALSAGGGEVKVMLVNTPIRTLGNWISLVSWLSLLVVPFRKPFLAKYRR